MALHALGNHHIHNDTQRNYTLAKVCVCACACLCVLEDMYLYGMFRISSHISPPYLKIYLEKGSALNSPDSLFSLAMLYKEGLGLKQKDIFQAVQLLAQAINLGHERSMNYLGHALYDTGT